MEYIVGGQTILDALDRIAEKSKIRDEVKERLIAEGFYGENFEEYKFNLAWSRDNALKFHHILIDEFGFKILDIIGRGVLYIKNDYTCKIVVDEKQSPIQYYLIFNKPY